MKKKNVLILGCGPSALFAAHASECAGLKPIIVSKKRKSEMFGAQYLHRPIPEVSGDGFQVSYELKGFAEGYKEKVYGLGYRGTVSPDELLGEHTGWDIRSAYDELWQHYQDGIENVEFSSPIEVASFLAGVPAAHFVSTIPAVNLCANPNHGFSATRVWSIGDAPERGVFVPTEKPPTNTVVCSGLREDSWYRKSNILGFNTVEWPTNRKPPFDGVAEVIKPTGTNCNCLPQVHRAGRYGKFQKGVLSHESFYETYYGLTGEEWS